MGPPSSTTSSLDIELTHLDGTSDPYKPGLTHQSLRDDYDSDDDEDGGEHALLGENRQTNWRDKTQSKLWEQIRSIVVEVSCLTFVH